MKFNSKMAVDANFDGRQCSEMRSMCCEQSILNKADGSASFSQGILYHLYRLQVVGIIILINEIR